MARKGSHGGLGQNAEALTSLTPPATNKVGSYALYRGTNKPEILSLDRKGQITKGAFIGRTIGQMLQTALREGWLAYKLRSDGWYSAEWWPERKTIALCKRGLGG